MWNAVSGAGAGNREEAHDDDALQAARSAPLGRSEVTCLVEP